MAKNASVAVHLVCVGTSEYLAREGRLPYFGPNRPDTIFCWPGLSDLAYSLKEVLDRDGTSTKIVPFEGDFSIPTQHDYLVIMGDPDYLDKIALNLLSDFPVQKLAFKNRKFTGGNLTSIHFPLVGKSRVPWIIASSIPVDFLGGIDV